MRGWTGAGTALLLATMVVACSAETGPDLGNAARWEARLAKGDPEAVKTLKAAGPDAVALLETLLASEDPAVVANAGLVAEGLGEAAGPLAEPLLAAVVRYPDDPRFLGPLRAGAARPTLAPHLLRVLEQGSAAEKAAALNVLTHYGDLAAPGIPAILPFLKADEELSRLHAMNTLSGIGAAAIDTIGELEAAAARATTAHERRTATSAIRHIQAKAKAKEAGAR